MVATRHASDPSTPNDNRFVCSGIGLKLCRILKRLHGLRGGDKARNPSGLCREEKQPDQREDGVRDPGSRPRRKRAVVTERNAKR